MIHRLTAIIDKERTWEKIINIDYLYGFEPHADKDGIYIVFNTINESFKFHYTSLEMMMKDYEKLHTSISESFSQTHTVVEPIDVSTDKNNDTLLG